MPKINDSLPPEAVAAAAPPPPPFFGDTIFTLPAWHYSERAGHEETCHDILGGGGWCPSPIHGKCSSRISSSRIPRTEYVLSGLLISSGCGALISPPHLRWPRSPSPSSRDEYIKSQFNIFIFASVLVHHATVSLSFRQKRRWTLWSRISSMSSVLRILWPRRSTVLLKGSVRVTWQSTGAERAIINNELRIKRILFLINTIKNLIKLNGFWVWRWLENIIIWYNFGWSWGDIMILWSDSNVDDFG